MRKILIAGDLLAVLLDRGIIPAECRRAVIDMKAGEVVRILYEVFAEPSLIDAIVEAKLEVIAKDGQEAKPDDPE